MSIGLWRSQEQINLISECIEVGIKSGNSPNSIRRIGFIVDAIANAFGVLANDYLLGRTRTPKTAVAVISIDSIVTVFG